MSSEPEKHLEKALTKLKAAKLLQKHGLYDDAASRAYYAMLHSARAALSKLGLSPKTHAGVIRAFGQHLVKTGTINKTHGENLAKAKDLREKGNYSPYYTTPKETAETLVKNAEELYAETKEKLEEIR